MAIGFFVIVSVVVALAGRVTLGPISFAGADVPALIATVLVLVRIAPWLRTKLPIFPTDQWVAGLWLVIGFLGSLGWYFYLHPFLFRVVTPFRATRTPARWAAIAYVGIAVLAAVGAAELIRRRRTWMAPALLVLALLEVYPRVRWTHIPPVAPVYAWIAEERPRAILELPMTGEGLPFLYLYAQTQHRVPLVNGTSGFETPAHEELRQMEIGEPLIAKARDAGAELAILHGGGDSLPGADLVRRFGSDAVFRIRRGPADTASGPRAAPPR